MQPKDEFIKHELNRGPVVQGPRTRESREWHLAWQGPGLVDQVKRELEESGK